MHTLLGKHENKELLQPLTLQDKNASKSNNYAPHNREESIEHVENNIITVNSFVQG